MGEQFFWWQVFYLFERDTIVERSNIDKKCLVVCMSQHTAVQNLTPPTFLFVRIRHYSKGNNIVWKKGRKSYEGMGFTTDWAHLGTTETHP